MADPTPVENKVWAGTIGGGAGAAIATFVIWMFGVTVWNVVASADNADDAIAAVPFPVVGIVYLLLSTGGTFLAGYLAKHTPRPAPETEAEATAAAEAEKVVEDYDYDSEDPSVYTEPADPQPTGVI